MGTGQPIRRRRYFGEMQVSGRRHGTWTKSQLGSVLAGHVHEGSLYERAAGGWVRCFACGHRCKIAPGKEGICRVRFNEGGVLKVPFGYVGGLAIDPVEKKPFFHVLPGSSALSFGMLGCDYRCGYCQNWITSQALRDPEAIAPVEMTTADRIVSLALRRADSDNHEHV